MDLLLDPNNWDLVFHNGPLSQEYTTQPDVKTVSQRLKIRLLTFRGEWFLDTEYGVPYWEILGHKIPKSRVDRIIQQEILKERGVKGIVSFTSTFVNRAYSASFKVRVTSGQVTDTITITPAS